MFFKKKQSKKDNLCDFVEKKNDTGYVFININNDLGEAVRDGVDDWPPLMLMAYGYARRTAVAALYIQGLVEEDLYDHVKAFFKSIQIQTGHTVEFQEKAFTVAVDFMKGYSHLITKILVKKIVQVAEEYEIPSGALSDENLFQNVIETTYSEQNENSTNYQSSNISNIAIGIAKEVNERIDSKSVAYQFVLEELDAARQGNEAAIQFVNNSGFNPSEYEGALQSSFEAVDGPDGPQQFLSSSVRQYSSDKESMINLRIQVVKNIIDDWELKPNYKAIEQTDRESEENIISKLLALSESSSTKTCRMSIQPFNEIWSWEFEFSDEELEEAQELVQTLYELRGGDFIAPEFNIVKEKNDDILF